MIGNVSAVVTDSMMGMCMNSVPVSLVGSDPLLGALSCTACACCFVDLVNDLIAPTIHASLIGVGLLFTVLILASESMLLNCCSIWSILSGMLLVLTTGASEDGSAGASVNSW